ncbi:5-formyltetrahydrofolate cyclo-ligase [Sporomusa acidovorans]|uniref:5-formyltetrahydrofolate cyclo-ligase n=1 Tax=Sporomusa acidovorans (strain ATCC 49682 / DSM 3132 / Mol) TaxID=1123286 RepID=A0ABZ3J3F5_SPOA4|nr:5-formyltetrahydrofolate cyclo-ligase [Sporomusa acidovorans]OZC20887.1 putative 5-formyltetrahydrofolate cyclo-ligase [Sporomusa acidovorans DSM 3132]SDE60124.1 5-formyltetrahydrofolate cyclo-ligase [Sporomusa acidovorans]
MEVNKDAKQELRKNILAVRRSMSKEAVAAGSSRLAEHIRTWPVYQAAKNIMLYLAMPDEPHLDKVISHALAAGKTLCVPFMHATRGLMDAAVIKNLDDLVVGQFNLLTPNPATLKLLEPRELDLIIVPGVAFDKAGRRLGMGAGYYDRFLPKATKAELIGAAWAAQILEKVPTDEHDRPVNYLVTEEGIFTRR